MNRKFAWLVTLLLLACVHLAEAQQPKKVHRIGVLSPALRPSEPTRFPINVEAFLEGLRELGYVEKKNLIIEYRWAEAKLDRLPDLAADLVKLNLDLIVSVGGTEPALALKNATKVIPIVFAASGDPVLYGLVDSLARPGGNITGVSNSNQELSGKRLEILKETFPNVTRIGILWQPKRLASSQVFKETQATARALGLELQSLDRRVPRDFESAFKVAAEKRSEAVLVPSSPYFFLHRAKIADLAIKNRLPAIYADREYVLKRGLMSYGPDLAYLYRRAATYADKILKGTKPGDLPVERPMKLELVINVETARQMGLTIPPSVLARADRVIK